MENYFPFHHISPLESMIIDIKENSQGDVWITIESISDAFKRCNARKLYTQALKRIDEQKKHDEK